MQKARGGREKAMDDKTIGILSKVGNEKGKDSSKGLE